MLFLRKILFYSFLVTYLVFCPLIILYAFGFLFKPGAKGGVVKTGLIYLETAPAGAEVYLGSSLYAQKTPATLAELLPGAYQITLSLDGYLRWSRQIKAKANKAAVFDKIILIPVAWRANELDARSFWDITPISLGNFLILSQGLKARDYYVYNFSTNKLKNLFIDSSVLSGSTVKRIFRIPQSNGVIFEVDASGKRKFIGIEESNQQIKITDISELFTGGAPLRIEWDPQDSGHIFSLCGRSLNKIDLDTRAVYPGYFENIRGYGIFNKKLYILDELDTLSRMNYDKGFREYLLQDPILGKFLFDGKLNIRVMPFSESVIVFLDDSGELLTSRLPHKFAGIEEGVLGVAFDPKGNRLLLWKKDALGILDFSAEKTGNVAFQKGARLYWLFKGARAINQVFWAYDYSHVVFKEADQVYILELVSQGPIKMDKVVRVKKGSSIYYSEESGILYYLEKTKGAFSSIQIISAKNLGGQALPEKVQEVISRGGEDKE